MKIELVSFGALTIEGKHYTNDIVIKKGEIKKRNKKASKAYRDQYNHTPLSAEEDIPWKGVNGGAFPHKDGEYVLLKNEAA